MDPVTHVATGALIAQVLPGPSRFWTTLAGVAFALLPDIDYFLIYTDRLAFIRDHRGFTHSLLALPLLALLGALLGRALGGPRWFRPLLLLGLAVLASHLLLDLFTSYGTQILLPFSRKRLALDWLFIIDPYLTALLLAGFVAAVCSAAWGRQVGAFSLAVAGVYILLCASYHHQALNLARQVFHQPAASHQNSEATAGTGPLTVAALPQPFSCRRWQLIAAAGREVQQAFVQFPYLAWTGFETRPGPPAVTYRPANPGFRVPDGPYRSPDDLLVLVWNGLPAPDLTGYPEARAILKPYLEFARFPLLRREEIRGDGQLLEWLDLRFSVPGRDLPFVLRLCLDAQGRVQHWRLGHGAGK
jgi:inner membrane protein